MRRVLLPLMAGFVIMALACTAEAVEYSPTTSETVAASEVANHIGDVVTACGKVAAAQYEVFTKGRPTVFQITKPFPFNDFSVVIWEKDKRKFEDKAEDFYMGKQICATGEVQGTELEPEIVAQFPEQFKLAN